VNKDENGKITLKIADFGVSKTTGVLQTLCGYIFFFVLILY
jgi:hypothetical protein